MTGAEAVLLRLAYRHRIVEPTVEAGFETVFRLTDGAVTEDAFRDAVSRCVADRLLHDPVRLPEGALQCHWHLELTAAGVAAVRGGS